MVDIDVVVPMVFRDGSLYENLERVADLGVEAVEIFTWSDRDREELRAALDRCGLDVAAITATGVAGNTGKTDSPGITDPEYHEQAVADLEASVEAAADLDCGVVITTVGPDWDHLDRSTQHEAVVDALAAAAPAAEEAGVTIAPEPLNHRVDHAGYYLLTSDEGYEIVDEVDSPAVKVMFDVYHQQVTEGDVTRRLTENVEQVGHVHVADNPGRIEPGTGELNYANIFRALDEAGYDGYVGVECFPTGDPEDAVRDVLDLAETA